MQEEEAHFKQKLSSISLCSKIAIIKNTSAFIVLKVLRRWAWRRATRLPAGAHPRRVFTPRAGRPPDRQPPVVGGRRSAGSPGSRLGGGGASCIRGSRPRGAPARPALAVSPSLRLPSGQGALTRCACSSVPGCPACCTARTWCRAAALPGALLSVCALLASPRAASVLGLSSCDLSLGFLALGVARGINYLESSPF